MKYLFHCSVVPLDIQSGEHSNTTLSHPPIDSTPKLFLKSVNVKTGHDCTQSGKSPTISKFNLIVGPNNAGKTTMLEDIRGRISSGARYPAKIVNSVQPDPPILDNEFQMTWIHRDATGNATWTDGLRIHSAYRRPTDPVVGLFPAAVRFLDINSRLSSLACIIAKSPEPDHPASCTLQQLLKEPHKQDQIFAEIQDLFKKISDTPLQLEISVQYETILYAVCKDWQLPSHGIGYERRQALDRLATPWEKLGPAYRSIITLMANIMLFDGPIVCIDEIECYLGPTEAEALGKWLGNYLTKPSTRSQFFVSCHTSYFLEGLMPTLDPSLLACHKLDRLTHFLDLVSCEVRLFLFLFLLFLPFSSFLFLFLLSLPFSTFSSFLLQHRFFIRNLSNAQQLERQCK